MMSNFSPKLQDATDEQLLYMVNELDFRVVPLASDELTRRTLKQLHLSIVEANKQAVKLEVANYRLQMLMVVLTAIGTLIVSFPVLRVIIQWLMYADNIPFLPSILTNSISGIISGILAVYVVWKLGNNPSSLKRRRSAE